MVFFGSKKEEDMKKLEGQILLNEFKNFKQDVRTLLDKLENKIEVDKQEYLQYLGYLVTLAETMENSVADVLIRLEKLEKRIDELEKKLPSLVDALKSEFETSKKVELDSIKQLEKKYTLLIHIIGDLLERELRIAREKINQILREDLEIRKSSEQLEEE